MSGNFPNLYNKGDGTGDKSILKDGKGKNGEGGTKVKMIYINDQIKAPTIIIIDDEKKNIGTFSRKRALELAEEQGLDLVQIAYNPEDMVSTVRLTDYGKYMYQKGKEEKEKRKLQKTKEMKEIKISYMIGENDLQLKIKKMKEFLSQGTSVKVSIKLKGRERLYMDKALEKILYVKDALAGIGRTQYDLPKKEPQGYSIVLFAK